MLLLTARSVALRMYTPASLSLIGDVHTEQHLIEISDAFCLPVHQMHLQVARTLVAQVSPPTRDSLRALSDAGAGFVLTGAEGPSDVEFAADHAFREVHLSRGLTQAAASDDDAVRVVQEIVERAHRQRMLVGATGVIDRLHERALLRAGCDLGSGPLYGEPEPAAEIEDPVTFPDAR
jgi:EAL domain-containing protein (putative c-di-GMP-specific phosphodiesterase class I)